jgi:cytochrome c oxidase cbb3-type subunit I
MSSAPSTTPDPDAPLSAAIDRSLRHPVMFFLTSAAAWLAVSILLGVIASAKVHSPGFLDYGSWLAYGRLFPAHVNLLVYGWGMQAAFAVILWLTARLSRKTCTNVGTILTAGHVWNLTVAAGTIGILAGYGTGMHWMEFPAFTWPVLLVCYAAIVLGSFVQFRVRPEGRVHISQWYLLAAMFWFPWIFITANTLLHCLPGHPLMAAGINAWFHSAMIFLFFVPVAAGAASYLAPKVTGLPLFSDALARLGFWSLAVIAPWAGMQKLAGAPLPSFLAPLGAAATVLLFIPAFAVAFNALRTSTAAPETLVASPTLRFTVAGSASLIVLAVASVALNLPGSTLRLSQFSISGYGFDMLALYGVFSLTIFAATYFIVPRVTCREWPSSRLIKIHFMFSVYGTIFVALVAVFGGLMQGMGQEDWKTPWASAAGFTRPYAVTITLSWLMILLANGFFFLQLLVMWLRLGRRGADPTLFSHEEHHDSPHGSDGLADDAGPAHAH